MACLQREEEGEEEEEEEEDEESLGTEVKCLSESKRRARVVELESDILI